MEENLKPKKGKGLVTDETAEQQLRRELVIQEGKKFLEELKRLGPTLDRVGQSFIIYSSKR